MSLWWRVIRRNPELVGFVVVGLGVAFAIAWTLVTGHWWERTIALLVLFVAYEPAATVIREIREAWIDAQL